MRLSLIMIAVTFTSYTLLFFFNDTATTEIYTLSLHDALPISYSPRDLFRADARPGASRTERMAPYCGGEQSHLGRRTVQSAQKRQSPSFLPKRADRSCNTRHKNTTRSPNRPPDRARWKPD